MSQASLMRGCDVYVRYAHFQVAETDSDHWQEDVLLFFLLGRNITKH